MNQDTPYTVKQCAAYLHLHPKTVTRLVRQKKLPAARINGRLRFYCHEVDVWIKTGRAI